MNALIIAYLSALTPAQAAQTAAEMVGRPDIAPALIRVCYRESRCKRLGIHARDAKYSTPGYWGQVSLGHINRACQPWALGWATRGAFGLSASAHWEYLPACYDPATLDLPIVSAMVAAKKYLRRCDGGRTRMWCPKRG